MNRLSPPSRPMSFKEEKKRATQQRLVDAAGELFDMYGYENVSVTEIARAAGVTHGIINAYFTSKAGLLFEVRRRKNYLVIDATNEVAHGTGTLKERLDRIAELWIDLDLQIPHQTLVLRAYVFQMNAETAARLDEQMDKSFEVVRGVLREYIEKGELHADLVIDDWISSYRAILFIGTLRALRGQVTGDACKNTIKRRITHLLDGIRA